MDSLHFDNTYSVIDLDAIAANFRAIREKAGVPVMAVVKADAYGHGAVPVARLLQNQCAFFGVSSVPEAMVLRQAGILHNAYLYRLALPLGELAKIFDF